MPTGMESSSTTVLLSVLVDAEGGGVVLHHGRILVRHQRAVADRKQAGRGGRQTAEQLPEGRERLAEREGDLSLQRVQRAHVLQHRPVVEGVVPLCQVQETQPLA